MSRELVQGGTVDEHWHHAKAANDANWHPRELVTYESTPSPFYSPVELHVTHCRAEECQHHAQWLTGVSMHHLCPWPACIALLVTHSGPVKAEL
ncbi:hypothetical protein HaLaN_22856 [Haematococcus lacustris]|uniref:Uncharacterized protein n=1 Tax=Haematococcus lacustris TaxID=44745 RepID=A0A699ZRK8_HAELA|nr:hypothetical protein HaLaN_22856 [Haematococcus lacustris]